jgi:hypothetical protein
MLKILFSKLGSHTTYVCQLGTTPVVKRTNVLHYKKLFRHFSGLWARLHERCNYDLKKQHKTMHALCLALLHTLGIIHKW